MKILETMKVDILSDLDEKKYCDSLDDLEGTLSLEEKQNFLQLKIIDLDKKECFQFEVNKKILLFSNYFKTVLECETDDNLIELTTEIVTVTEMKILLKFLQYNQGKLSTDANKIRPERINSLSDLFKPWECEFIEKIFEFGYLNEVIKLGNYFDVKLLLYLACAKHALLIRNLQRELTIETNQTIGTLEYDQKLIERINLLLNVNKEQNLSL